MVTVFEDAWDDITTRVYDVFDDIPTKKWGSRFTYLVREYAKTPHLFLEADIKAQLRRAELQDEEEA